MERFLGFSGIFGGGEGVSIRHGAFIRGRHLIQTSRRLFESRRLLDHLRYLWSVLLIASDPLSRNTSYRLDFPRHLKTINHSVLV